MKRYFIIALLLHGILFLQLSLPTVTKDLDNKENLLKQSVPVTFTQVSNAAPVAAAAPQPVAETPKPKEMPKKEIPKSEVPKPVPKKTIPKKTEPKKEVKPEIKEYKKKEVKEHKEKTEIKEKQHKETVKEKLEEAVDASDLVEAKAKELLEYIGLNLRVDVNKVHDRTYLVNLYGEDNGIIIGKDFK